MHPEWTEDDAATEEWGPEVSSYAIDDGRSAAADRSDSAAKRDRGARRRARDGDRADLSMARARHPWSRRAPRRSGVLAAARRPRLRRGGRRSCTGRATSSRSESRPSRDGAERPRALVRGPRRACGRRHADRPGKGFEFPADWANKGVPPEQILASLQPLLELPVELVLPTHGPPTDRAVARARARLRTRVRQRPAVWKPRYATRRMRERAWADADLRREHAAQRAIERVARSSRGCFAAGDGGPVSSNTAAPARSADLGSRGRARTSVGRRSRRSP